jgi:hypothetical protein
VVVEAIRPGRLSKPARSTPIIPAIYLPAPAFIVAREPSRRGDAQAGALKKKICRVFMKIEK